MKINRLILICMIVSTCSLKIQSQDKNGKSFLNKFYLRAGLELSSLNNTNDYSSLADNANFFVSVMYDYTPKLQLDVNYSYVPERYSQIYAIHTFTVADIYDYTHAKNFNSHDLGIKANYYFNAKRELNPFYITGGITGAIQSVFEIAEENDNRLDSTGHNYIHTYNVNYSNRYNRILLGPEAGVGLFLNFGRVNFQSEFTYSARFSPFKDRNYRELSFNLFNGLVYKF